MSAREYPSIEYIRQCLRYEDGRIYWLKRPREHFADDWAFKVWNKRFPGKEAGYLIGNLKKNKKFQMRWQVLINSCRYYRYVLVWFIHTGEWVLSLDHKDRNPLNDRFDNLREADQYQNMGNSSLRSNNTSGMKGVSWCKKRGKHLVQIAAGLDGNTGRHKVKFLGYFDDVEEAKAVYAKAAIERWGEFACPEG